MAEGKPIFASLMVIQRELKCQKNQYNSFGKYRYRSCEDIVEAVKPLLNEHGLILTMSDDVVEFGNYTHKKTTGNDVVEISGSRIYIKATATVIDVVTGDKIEVTAMAREPEEKKGMDCSQITGTASSYARKYALNGLFAIDDTKDADTDQYKQQTSGAQNGAGRAQNVKPNNYTKTPVKASQNEDLMAKAKRQLKAEVDRIGCTWDEVRAISGLKLGKTETKEMSAQEVGNLAANLEKWILEESASA